MKSKWSLIASLVSIFCTIAVIYFSCRSKSAPDGMEEALFIIGCGSISVVSWFVGLGLAATSFFEKEKREFWIVGLSLIALIFLVLAFIIIFTVKN